ncbi:MAG: sugar phosphate isomerase/epimerase [Planctomycetes bacterium]|nr:sugar phosphate isomerase/epimerase [Planctomycetota bacterium]
MLERSISLYCFNRLLDSGDITKKAAMRFAHSVGFQAVEMLDFYWEDTAPRLEQADALKEEAAAEALTISCYTASNDLAIFDKDKWQAVVDRLLADVDVAVRLGAPVMRVESTFGPKEPDEDKTFDECVEPIARGLKLVVRRAADRGIRVALENHGRFVGSSERVERIIEAVGEPNFGACIDIGNFLVVDEDPVEAVTRLAPAAVHVHVKDMYFFDQEPPGGGIRTTGGNFLVGAIFGEGDVDVTTCLDLITKAGYTGALSLEFEGRENLFYAIARASENISEVVRRLPLS